METQAPNTVWIQDLNEANRRVFYRGRQSLPNYGYVGQYAGSNDYNWQAVRNHYRISGITEGDQAAKDACDAAMDLPIEEFNARVAADLMDKLRDLEKQLLDLQPDTRIFPGYHAGFEAGYSTARAKLLNALEG